MKKPIETRFFEKVSITDSYICWEWQAQRDKDGYGLFRVMDRHFGAHRVSYVISKGLIPVGKLVLHSCDNPGCVNPDHLYIGNHSRNMKDRSERKRDNSFHGRKSHCKNGHKFTIKNTYYRKNPYGRTCRSCQRLRSKKHRVSKA